jgi:acetyl-CoA C-acetyltransferase
MGGGGREGVSVLDGILDAGAIVGVGELPPNSGEEGQDSMALMLEAGRLALEDAEMELSEIDGLLVHSPDEFLNLLYFPVYVAEYLELPVRFADQVDLAGAAGPGMVWRGLAAIAAGQCKNILCLTGTFRDIAGYYNRADEPHPAKSEFIDPYGPMAVNSEYAMFAMRHMHEFGTTAEQLAKIAADERTSGAANPNSFYPGKPASVEDILASRMICDPLHLLEIVRPTSSAAALVIADADRAKSCPQRPVTLRGAAERHDAYIAFPARDLVNTGIQETGPGALAMAGVEHSEIDVLCVYDSYTITTLLTIEDAGFCEKGTGGEFVESHDLTFSGDFPVNPNGGQLCIGQAGMQGGMSHVTEAVRQIRGTAIGGQVADCELAFVHGNGGTFSDHVSLVLGGER